MLVMTKAILALMIGFIISVIIGLITIPILKKTKIKQVESTYLSKKHKEKAGTPTMGGIIFILSTIITFLISLPNLDKSLINSFPIKLKCSLYKL